MPRRVEIVDMVGIIAMAGTVEEYDEPCKKPKKDAEDSSTNTITSYFSPLSKSVDIAFPSPKSSNIMDYFKKTPSGRNVASDAFGECEGKNSAVTSVDCHKESSMASEEKHQTPKRKRLSRRINLSRKLNECHEVIEVSDVSNSSIGEVCGVRSGVGVLGSDTAALIAQLCAESQELFEENEDSVCVDSNVIRRRTKAGNRKKSCKEPSDHSSKISKKTRKRKVAGNNEDPSRQTDVELVTKDGWCEKGVERPEIQGATVPVVIESEKMCLSETSLDTTADKTCQVNDSTVTVSFEDFIKNQETEESSAEKAAGDDSEIIEESNTLPNLTDDMSSAAPQPVSPKTMTVHVQIHSSPISTSFQSSKTKQKKIASIFLRKKTDSESEAVEIQPVSPHPIENTEPVPARRSNVVIGEEELELSVLDVIDKSPVKAKCSRAEREQFMNAFRQPPSSDPAKTGLKKVAHKPKASKQGLTPGEAAEGGDDEPNLEKGKEELAQITKAEMSSKGSKDARVEKSAPGDATMKKNKRLKRRKVRKAERKSPDDCEIAGEEINPHLKTCDEATKESRDPKPFDPATTRSSETCRVTRRSLRQQRDALDYCLTPDKAIGVDCLGVPVRRSTPKLTRWSSEENSIYKAEMIPATCNKSPIRMKFTRITRSQNDLKAKEMDENTEFTPRSNQRMSRSKNMAKAKRLVEKAKVQSKCRNPVESLTPLRRSTRQQAKSDGKSHGTEDLTIVSNAESDSDCIIQCEKKSKKLRNLSDVLGKNPGSTSSTKSTAADLKVASIFCCKKAVKAIPSGPIAIVDEDSCNGSENSQDDEQFRAKRQFLMSGLPDTLKKHIAKTAAVMEVYSAAGAAFQTVIHVQQKSHASLFWNLAWPNSAILNQLQDVSKGVDGILDVSLALGDFSDVKYITTTVAPRTGLSNWRTEFSQDIQKCLLEEIRSSNQEFPVRKLFKPLLQKRNEYLAETLKAGTLNKLDSSVIELDTEPQQALPLCSSPQRSSGKRKRKEERQERKQKRRILDSDEDSVILIDGQEYTPEVSAQPTQSTKRNSREAQKQNCAVPSRNRLRRSVKKKQQELECKTEPVALQNVPAPSQVSELTDHTKEEQAAVSDDIVKEDLLWTEKYQPQHSSQLVGNISAIRKLRSWLMEWKKRADREEKKKQKEKKNEKDKKLDVWDNSDFNLESSEDEDFLCNTVLITGPSGVGKTAAVYACAQELGFKVFEVNASSQRSGRQILSQLKEATQSHQVDKQGANALKPAFFNSNKLLSSQTAKSPRKANSPKKVVSSPRKAPQSPKGRRPKKNLTPMSLTNFFKGLSKPNKSEETEKPEDKEMNDNLQKNSKAQKSSPQVTDVTKAPSVPESKDTGSEESSRKSATSLILFEEVDVIFDDDAGFLNAIKTFMATAKRPVILTTTDPNFSLMFECCFEEICFKVPSSTNVASYLQLLCLAENLRTDAKDLTALLALNKCDIRQSILHLQFWVRSGGGYHVDKPLPAEEISMVPSQAQQESVGNAVAAEDTPGNSSKNSSIVKTQDVPKCNTGCTENLLGLKHITGSSSDLFSMFKEVVSQEQWRNQMQVLLEFQRRQLDFIFHNLEFLLPLPVRVVPDPQRPENLTTDAEPPVCDPASTAARRLQGGNTSVDASPVKTSGRLKRHRKAALLDDSDLFDMELNESDTFVTLPNEIPTSPSVAGKVAESQANGVGGEGPSGNKTGSSKVTGKKQRTPAEQKCCESVSLCLGSLAEFADSISFLDCCLHRGAVEREGSCGQRGYHWAAAEIKNGMLDEGRAESGDWWSSHDFGEMRVTVEGLSWKKCRSQIQQIMDPSVTKCEEAEKDPIEELTLQISNRQNHNAASTQFSHSHASTASKRIEVLKTVFSSKAFVSLGNRRVSAVEYLPALRTICRTEKLKEQGKLKRRFLHYLDSAHLELPKRTLEALAASFP
ncbi:ATPase family AAA domain-containing protein 5 isoform X2 [Mustelus asterias]